MNKYTYAKVCEDLILLTKIRDASQDVIIMLVGSKLGVKYVAPEWSR